jgi:formylglycine-generating enzyme required for sulfatase activity
MRQICAIGFALTLIGAAHGNEELTVELPNGTVMEFVWIEPGAFTMGTTEEQEETLRGKEMWVDLFENEHPAHDVTITQGFYLAKCELTQGQWEAVMGTAPWSGRPFVAAGPDHPAGITWDDAQAFIQRLNEEAGEDLYRLPTEAEWEYACRAGTTTLWSFGDDENQMGQHAWHQANTIDVGEGHPHQVRQREPNPWGLHDTHGNVLEWCQDWYGVYPSESLTDPTGPASGNNRVVRGGCILHGPRLDFPGSCRSACRGFLPPDLSPDHHPPLVGARLVRMGPRESAPITP